MPYYTMVTMMLQGWKDSTAATVGALYDRSIDAIYWQGHGGPSAGSTQLRHGSLRPRGLGLLVTAGTESAYLFYTLRP